jgi:hypothetical protein
MQDRDAVWAKLQPDLAVLEARRKTLVLRVCLAIVGLFGLMLGLPMLVALIDGTPILIAESVIYAIIGAAIGGFAIYWTVSPLYAFGRQVKRQVFGPAAQAMGLSYVALPGNPPQLETFKRYKLLPKHSRLRAEDRIAGEHAGVRFDVGVTKLDRRGQGKASGIYVEVFSGVLVRLGIPHSVKGMTLVRPDMGPLNALTDREIREIDTPWGALQRVGLADREFEELFETYGTDPAATRALFTPTFIGQLKTLASLLRGGSMRCVVQQSQDEEAAERSELLIVVKSPGFLVTPDLFEPLTRPDILDRLYEDVQLIENIIDTLLGHLESDRDPLTAQTAQ